METNPSLELINLVVALPFVVAALLLFVNAMKFTNRFFYKDYRGDAGESFNDNLTSMLYFSLSMGFLLTGAFTALGEFSIWILLLCPIFVIFLLPIGVVGSYWQRFLADRMIGGSQPVAGYRYAFYEKPKSPTQQEVDVSSVKIPRREQVTAAMIALYVFGSIFYLLNETPWVVHDWVDILIKMAISALIAFVVNKIILSSDLSHRVQKLREGEPVDDD